MHQNLWEGPSLTCNKTSLNGPIEPGMVSFERYASSPVGNVQFHLFGRIKEPQKDFFLSSPKESWQILPQKVDRQKLLYLYLHFPCINSCFIALGSNFGTLDTLRKWSMTKPKSLVFFRRMQSSPKPRSSKQWEKMNTSCKARLEEIWDLGNQVSFILNCMLHSFPWWLYEYLLLDRNEIIFSTSYLTSLNIPQL